MTTRPRGAARRPQARRDPSSSPGNPADDTAYTRPLARDLRWHVGQLARHMPEDAAVGWVYLTVLTAWAEDHGLVDPWLRPPAAARREAFLSLPGMTDQAWQARAMAALCRHPATWCLLDPKWTPLATAVAAPAACRDLAAWWQNDAPPLAYPASAGPGSLSGWVPGDLLQHLSDSRRARHALVQTPWWVCDFILDKTLLPAVGEFRGTALRVIDPACGTGHFLVRAISCLWEWYTTGALAPRSVSAPPVTGGTPVPPAQAAAMILSGLHGCDKDPLTAAVARLRYTVALGSLMHRAGLINGPLRIDAIPPFQVPVVPGDSLLARKVTPAEYERIHPGLAAIVNLGAPQTRPRPPGPARPPRQGQSRPHARRRTRKNASPGAPREALAIASDRRGTAAGTHADTKDTPLG